MILLLKGFIAGVFSLMVIWLISKSTANINNKYQVVEFGLTRQIFKKYFKLGFWYSYPIDCLFLIFLIYCWFFT